MMAKLRRWLRRARHLLRERADLRLIRASGLFDEAWYLEHNPDVAQAKVDPLLHYLRHGGSEGRDPGPSLSSGRNLDAHEDVGRSDINPLIHYLKFGREEGREIGSHVATARYYPYRCPVCNEPVWQFAALSAYYHENLKKYGCPFTFDDMETLNAQQYQCPLCGAHDRDRLYALYLGGVLSQTPLGGTISLLDIAPSPPLRSFLLKHPNLEYRSADKYMEDVDFKVDITRMDIIASESLDWLICSHVLEHVADDRKALSELYRILAPGGRGIVMVPIVLGMGKIDEDPTVTDIGERWRRFGQDDHVRTYSKGGFIDRVQEAGFHIQEYGVGHFGEDSFERHGISLTSVLYIAVKQHSLPTGVSKQA